jgi:23S rRNA (cytosine1962-C5)-methyltransferase
MNHTKDHTQFQPQRLAVKLNKKGEHYVSKGHPWIFSNSIQKVNKTPQTGDLAVIFRKSDNKLMGLGLYDTDSDIHIKMLYHGSRPVQIDSDFFQTKIDAAFLKRQDLLVTDTNSYRLIYGESDGFPGLIADVYHKVLVIKLYSGIWFPYLPLFLESLIKVSKTETLVLRLSRKLQNSALHSFKDGEVIYGSLQNEVVRFKEHGINFSAHLIKGHKTGYFLDHRFNRKTVGALSSGKTVLDVFSYAGGFSVHALAQGATAVTSLDISEQALEVARFNAGLNTHKGTHYTIAGDAFTELQRLIDEKHAYDIVVIDPPSFAKQQSQVPLAKKKYTLLAQLGTQLVKKDGYLILASCSSRVQASDFFELTCKVLDSTERRYRVERQTYHDTDHPIGFDEAAYLKCIYFRFLS